MLPGVKDCYDDFPTTFSVRFQLVSVRCQLVSTRVYLCEEIEIDR